MKKEIEKFADKLVDAYKKNKLISPLPIKYTKNILCTHSIICPYMLPGPQGLATCAPFRVPMVYTSHEATTKPKDRNITVITKHEW